MKMAALSIKKARNNCYFFLQLYQMECYPTIITALSTSSHPSVPEYKPEGLLK